MFARSSKADGQSWISPVAVTAAAASRATSFAMINGLPCCAFGKSEGGLYLVIAQNSFGSLWNEPLLVDGDAVPFRVSLITVNDLPAMAYFNGDHGPLRFVIYE